MEGEGVVKHDVVGDVSVVWKGAGVETAGVGRDVCAIGLERCGRESVERVWVWQSYYTGGTGVEEKV